ncbi:MAG TPA: DNA replication/repair protein RecF [Candidatus Tyrphobacter sp.]
MRLERLALSNIRNYTLLDLEPQNGLNVFIGANAQGKSNLLEAIAVLGIGKSFRSGRDADMIRDGCERGTIRGEAVRREGRVQVGCSIAKSPSGTRKTFTRAGRNVRYAQFLGALTVVTFVPADLALVSGTPGERRAFLNTALAQQDAAYYRALARYQSALRQKGALLRGEDAPDDELLGVYDRTLAESGAIVVLARQVFVEALAREAAIAHERWSGRGERLELRYAPNVAFEAANEEAIRAALTSRLREVARTERRRRMPLAGPHRDDLLAGLDGRPLSNFGSQGQQRTAVLALKIAEYLVMRDRAGEAPLLLLDDVLSELDEQRAAAFLGGVGDYEQAYVTATHRPPRLPVQSAIFVVEAAHVRREGSIAC